jgi:hypothetical protein
MCGYLQDQYDARVGRAPESVSNRTWRAMKRAFGVEGRYCYTMVKPSPPYVLTPASTPSGSIMTQPAASSSAPAPPKPTAAVPTAPPMKSAATVTPPPKSLPVTPVSQPVKLAATMTSAPHPVAPLPAPAAPAVVYTPPSSYLTKIPIDVGDGTIKRVALRIVPPEKNNKDDTAMEFSYSEPTEDGQLFTDDDLYHIANMCNAAWIVSQKEKRDLRDKYQLATVTRSESSSNVGKLHEWMHALYSMHLRTFPLRSSSLMVAINFMVNTLKVRSSLLKKVFLSFPCLLTLFLTPSLCLCLLLAAPYLCACEYEYVYVCSCVGKGSSRVCPAM